MLEFSLDYLNCASKIGDESDVQQKADAWAVSSVFNKVTPSWSLSYRPIQPLERVLASQEAWPTPAMGPNQVNCLMLFLDGLVQRNLDISPGLSRRPAPAV